MVTEWSGGKVGPTDVTIFDTTIFISSAVVHADGERVEKHTNRPLRTSVALAIVHQTVTTEGSCVARRRLWTFQVRQTGVA